MRRRILVALLLLLVAGPAAWYFAKNPERAALDADARLKAPGKFVNTSVGLTHYELAGPDTGTVVVLVHGFSVPAYIWDSTFTALSAEGFRVLRYDLIGRGWSERADIGYTPHDHGAQLRELLDSLRITEPVHIAGLSFGGLVASGFAAVFPERTRSLVLVDPVTRVRTLPRVISLPVVGDFVWQTTVVPTMPAGQPTDFLHPERFPDWESRYREQMQYRGFGRALRRAVLTQAEVDFPDLFSRVAANGKPVLLVWGRQDPTTPFERHTDVTSRIPAAEFFPVDSSGHLPHMEQTAAFNARLLNFLRQH
jgi:pimeloyl-ACP methyl ester carboxylesterase